MTAPMLGIVADLVPAAERRWRDTQGTLRRLRGPRRRGRDRLFRIYVTLLFGMPIGLAAAAAIRDADPLPLTEAVLLVERLSVAAPAVLLAAIVVSLRFAAWHGVVVISRADIDWLLTAPVPRVRVLRPRLVRVLWGLAGVGGFVGFAAAGGVALMMGVLAPALVAAAVTGTLGGAATGMLVGAVGWLLQCRPRWAARTLRAAPAVAIASAGVAVAGWSGPMAPPAAAVAAWSGPWGWAVVPSLITVTEHLSSPAAGDAGALASATVAGWALTAIAIALLAVLVAVVAAAAFRQLRAVPLQELRRREATATRLVASTVYAADLRGGFQARREAIASLAGRRVRSRRGPARSSLAVPWGSALLLSRSRERLAHAALWVAAAVVAGANGMSLGAVVLPLAVVLAYPAASALVEPLRVELEQRFLSRSGLLPVERTLRRQAIVPAVVLTLLGVVALTGAGLSGLLPAADAGAFVLATPPAAVLLVGCATVVVAGPGPDPRWLYSGDTGIMLLLAHLTQGAHLAVAVIGLPAMVAIAALTQGAPTTTVLLSVLLWSAATIAALDQWARRRLARFQ